MGPKTVRSTVLTAEEEAAIVAFRKHTLMPLDDCLYALQATVPHLTRSSLHRCFQRHGISRLPEVAGDKPAKQPFKRYPIGYFHIDIAEVRTEEGKLYLFVAVVRTSKFAFARLMQKATTVTARAFLDELVEAVPYKIHTVLTDNGIQFADLTKNRDGPTARSRGHPFDRTCWRLGIDHRLTKPNHPWTNGQVERMNRTLCPFCRRRPSASINPSNRSRPLIWLKLHPSVTCLIEITCFARFWIIGGTRVRSLGSPLFRTTRPPLRRRGLGRAPLVHNFSTAPTIPSLRTTTNITVIMPKAIIRHSAKSPSISSDSIITAQPINGPHRVPIPPITSIDRRKSSVLISSMFGPIVLNWPAYNTPARPVNNPDNVNTRT